MQSVCVPHEIALLALNVCSTLGKALNHVLGAMVRCLGSGQRMAENVEARNVDVRAASEENLRSEVNCQIKRSVVWNCIQGAPLGDNLLHLPCFALHTGNARLGEGHQSLSMNGASRSSKPARYAQRDEILCRRSDISPELGTMLSLS